MTGKDTGFDEQIAAHYEAWYKTEKGRRADVQEKALLKELLEHIPQARSVLEVGCGTGHFSRWLDHQGLTTVGLDISWGMLAAARTLNSVSLVQGNALRLPFADNAFDVTVFITTLEFLASPRHALVEALRVARYGIILGVLNRWSFLGLQRRLAGLFRPTLYDAAHFYGVGELKRLLASVAASRSHIIIWRTTLLGLSRLFPHAWPWIPMPLPWGGFIGMALVFSPLTGTENER